MEVKLVKNKMNTSFTLPIGPEGKDENIPIIKKLTTNVI